MTSSTVGYSYGPVPSRRLGKSLGINNIPPKVCSYSCVYCQVGRTTWMVNDRRAFYKPEDIFRDVQYRLTEAKKASEQVDYLAFVPDGEPTLDVNLGEEIVLLKTLGIPVGVITNGSLIWRNDIREELSRADWVSLKIDAVQETYWQLVNRPYKELQLTRVLDGMLAFAESFTGTLVTETMLVKGINDNDSCMKEIADFLHELQPSRAYLSIPIRPPLKSSVSSPDEEFLNRAYQIFTDHGIQAEFLVGYEGDAFATIGDIETDLLSITAVHPMREDAVSALLSRSKSSWEIVDRLVAAGNLAKTKYDGHFFFLRRFSKDHRAAR